MGVGEDVAARTATLVDSESGGVETGGATTAITVTYPGQENTAAAIRKINALPRKVWRAILAPPCS